MTERKSLESERAELVALADELERQVHRCGVEWSYGPLLQKASKALRRLAAQDQKPVAWVIPTGDNVRDNGFIDCMAWEEGEFTKPLYPKPFPPPAAGWDEAIEACQKIASEHDDDVYVDEDMNSARRQVVKFIVRDIEALRHNAPPDSGAGTAISELEPNETTIAALREADAAEPEARFNNVEDMMDWLDAPDHGGADAGVGETAPYNIKAIATVISLSYGEDPEADAELGRMCTADNKPVKCWEVYEEQAKALFAWFNAVLDSLSKPAPVAANASAEARLREALEHYAKEYCEGWCEQDAGCTQFDHDCGGCLARRALSQHPHASDCDKQGDPRPANCRFRLQDEGKSYPRSSCSACGKNIATGLGNRCKEVRP